jgi:hypothetical protein
VAREDSRVDEAGFGAIEVADLGSPLSQESITLRGSYDAVSDTYTPTILPNISVFTEHYSLDFQNSALGFVDFSPGDKALSVLKSDVPVLKPNDLIGDYVVKAVKDRGDFLTAHGSKQ